MRSTGIVLAVLLAGAGVAGGQTPTGEPVPATASWVH